MKICWDNIENIYIPKRSHAKCDFRRKSGGKLWYKDECEICGEPFLTGTPNGRFCTRSCKSTWININKRSYDNMKNNNPMFDEETKQKNIKSRCSFKHRTYLHNKAWSLFRKDYCENCNLTLQENYAIYNERFHMHNTLEPKNYNIMKPEAWQCLCRKCHAEIDRNGQGRRKINVNSIS